MKEKIKLPIEDVREEPYASILCYPKCDKGELERRIEELEMQGVTAIEFVGEGNAFNVPVLGRGYVGVVVVGHRYSQRVALKIRRVDADRADLFHEADMLSKANAVGVGPELVDASKNFLITQLIEGELLPVWLGRKLERMKVALVLGELLEHCWRLDVAGLDHGELSKAPKHVIVDHFDQPWIVDFETSSDKRKPTNVTGICQYLVMSGGTVPRIVSEILGERHCAEIIAALRQYKRELSREILDHVMQVCLY